MRKQNSPNTTIARYAISWLKEFVDNDDRYEQFLCAAGTGRRLPHDLPAHQLNRPASAGVAQQVTPARASR